MRRELPPLAVAALMATLLALWQLWPAWTTPGPVLPCSALHPDCVALQWLLSWLTDRVLGGELALDAPTLANYWPVGDRPVLGGDGPLALLHLPFQVVLGWPRSLLPFVTALLLANGLSGYALARAFGAGRWASLLGLVVLGICPFAAEELSAGRMSQALIAPLALFLASWRWTLTTPRVVSAVLSGALLALTSALYWYWGWMGVLAGAGVLAITLVEGKLSARMVHYTVFSAIFLTLIAPWASVFVAAWNGVPGVAGLTFPPPTAASDRLFSPLWAPAGASPAAVSSLLSLPAVLLGAAAFTSKPTRTMAVGISILALCFVGLALGDQGGASPYRLLYGLHPALQRFWWPIRHIAVVQMLLAVLGSVGLHTLLAERSRAQQVVGLGSALGLVIVGLGVAGAPLHATHTPMRLDDSAWTALKGLPEGAVLALPFRPESSSSNAPMLWQRVHGKPMLNGHSPWVARARPAGWQHLIDDNTFLVGLGELELGTQHGDRFAFTADDLRALQDAGLRWVVLDRSLWPTSLSANRQSVDQALDALFGRPVARSKAVSVWDLEHWTGETAASAPSRPWPPELVPGGPERAVAGRRPESPLFGNPAGPRSPRTSP